MALTIADLPWHFQDDCPETRWIAAYLTERGLPPNSANARRASFLYRGRIAEPGQPISLDAMRRRRKADRIHADFREGRITEREAAERFVAL